MKYFVAALCLSFVSAQIVKAAPSEPTIADQVQQTIAQIQQQATAAVSDLNTRFLQTTGAQSNEALLNTVQQQSQSYGEQVKGFADQINQQVSAQKTQLDANFAAIAKQLSDTAANLIGGTDPAKIDSLRSSFGNVLDQTNALNTQLKQQGDAVSSALSDTIEKLYEQTLTSAKNVAIQLDESKKS